MSKVVRKRKAFFYKDLKFSLYAHLHFRSTVFFHCRHFSLQLNQILEMGLTSDPGKRNKINVGRYLNFNVSREDVKQFIMLYYLNSLSKIF